MRTKPFIGAVLFLGVLFVLSPLYSLARDKYEEHEEREYRYSYEESDDDDRYEYSAPAQQITVPQAVDTSAYDATQQQLNAQYAALEAKRAHLEQQSAEQQRFAQQLSGIEQQLTAQRKTLETKAQELAKRKTEQDAISRQLDELERQLSSGTQAYNIHYPTDGSVAYTVTDGNFNGISDILEGLSTIALR